MESSAKKIVAELNQFQDALTEIKERFRQSGSGIHMDTDDIPKYKQLITELQDYLKDSVPDKSYRTKIHATYSNGSANFYRTPSLASVRDIIGTVAAIITRIERNPGFLGVDEKKAAPRAPINYPGNDQASLLWFILHMPISVWILFAGIVSFAFWLGTLFTK